MYAIIQTGGKQYKVEEGTSLRVEKLSVEAGSTVELEVVAVVNDGAVANKGKCTATVVEHGKGEKLNIFTYKAKKNVHKKQGHRQPYSLVKVTSIK